MDRQLFILQNAFGCLSAALQYLHNQRCRHKDIKPANILVKNGSVLLTDFGTSRNWAGDSGTTVGTSGPYTPAYAAPEVVEWESRNEAADIWSLGCVFLEMVVCNTVLYYLQALTVPRLYSKGGNWMISKVSLKPMALEISIQEQIIKPTQSGYQSSKISEQRITSLLGGFGSC